MKPRVKKRVIKKMIANYWFLRRHVFAHLKLEQIVKRLEDEQVRSVLRALFRQRVDLMEWISAYRGSRQLELCNLTMPTPREFEYEAIKDRFNAIFNCFDQAPHAMSLCRIQDILWLLDLPHYYNKMEVKPKTSSCLIASFLDKTMPTIPEDDMCSVQPVR